MNDLPNVPTHSSAFLFADDTKCFRHITTSADQQLLQSDINNLLTWSILSNLLFDPSKSCHLSFKQKFTTSYTINSNTITLQQIHKDLGVLVSINLEWSTHHVGRAYKILGLIRRTFSSSIQPLTKTKLYISLITSQLTYCSTIWRPHLLQHSCTIQAKIAFYLMHTSQQIEWSFNQLFRKHQFF